MIGEALLRKAQGLGHRRIAARLKRPPATVRGWLRTVARRAEPTVASARRWTLAIDGHGRAEGHPARSALADAVDALESAARACQLHLGCPPPWELAVALTGLLHGRPREPPGY